MSSLTQQQNPSSSMSTTMDDSIVVVSSQQHQQSSAEQPSLGQISDDDDADADDDSSDSPPSSSPSSSSSAAMIVMMVDAASSSPPAITAETDTTTVDIEDFKNKSNNKEATFGKDEESSPTSRITTESDTTTVDLEDGNKSNSEDETFGQNESSPFTKKEKVDDAKSQPLVTQLEQQSSSFSPSQQPDITPCQVVVGDELSDSASSITNNMMTTMPASPVCTTKTINDTSSTVDTVINNNNNNNNSNDECAVGNKIDEKGASATAATVLVHARRKLDIMDQFDKDTNSLLASMEMLGASFHDQKLEDESSSTALLMMEERTDKDVSRPVVDSSMSSPSKTTLHQQKRQFTFSSPNPKNNDNDNVVDDGDKFKEQLRHANMEINLLQKEVNATKTKIASLQDEKNVMLHLVSIVFVIAVVVEFFLIIIGGVNGFFMKSCS